MFFTVEDYKKIQQWLQHNSVKDTEFIRTTNPQFEDTVTIVQEGKNKKVAIKDLFAKGLIDFTEFPEIEDTNPNDEVLIIQDGKTNKVKISTFIADNVDFLNVTKAFNIQNCTLIEAATVIPEIFRKTGLEITFIAPSGNWMTYQYTSDDTDEDSWLDENNWSNALVNSDSLVIDNDTLVVKAGAVEVRDHSLKRIKLAEEVTNELDYLQQQINAINLQDTDVITTLSNKYVYKGYPLNITYSARVTLGPTVAATDIEWLQITAGNSSKRVERTNYVSISISVSDDTAFAVEGWLGSPYNIGLSGGKDWVNVVSPIYIGAFNDGLTNDEYVKNISSSTYLYSSAKPVTTLVGDSYTLKFTTSQRAVILTSTYNLGAKSNGFDFPFDRYKLDDGVYLYISQNTYSNQSQTLIFETKQY